MHNVPEFHAQDGEFRRHWWSWLWSRYIFINLRRNHHEERPQDMEACHGYLEVIWG